MKRVSLLPLLATALIIGVSARGQGTFQDLDFEAAQIVYVDSFHAAIVASNALPGWSVFAGTNHLSVIPFGILGATYPVQLLAQTNGGSLSGNFTVRLSRGFSQSEDGGSISQTGVIPADARALLFKAPMSLNGALAVSLGSQNLAYSALTSGPNYTVYGADITAFAGQNQTLSFSVALDPRVVPLDDIQFSSQPIPEPSAVYLILGAAGAFACYRRRAGPRSKKRCWS